MVCETRMASGKLSKQVSWSPSITTDQRRHRHTQQDQANAASEYVRIKLSNLSNFEDLISEEKWGSGAIFKAAWTREDGSTKEVAAKRLPSLNEKEAQILSGIRHKNIVVFYGAVIEPPQNFYFVMELCSDEILFDYIHPDKIDIGEAHEFAVAIANGMNYLHHQAPSAPIRHNNLCSGKIFLQVKGFAKIPKIGGFGNSQLHSGTQYTRSHGWVQLQGWMPPEAVEGRAISLKSDVYSFGIVFWELLTGDIPYDGKMIFETLKLIAEGKHPEIPSDCPEDWSELLQECWAMDPKQRPSFRIVLGCLEKFSFNKTRGDFPRTSSEESLSDSSESPGRFNQSYKWLLPQADYDLIEFGRTTYSGQLSSVKKAKYKEQEVAARVMVESQVKPSRFIQYMNIICQVQHENIVALIGGFHTPEMVVLFEWMPIILQHVCPIVDPDKLLIIAKDIANALSYLHNLKPNHLYHGSLSDRTVLLNKSKTQAKITDFNYYSLGANHQAVLNRFPNFTDPFSKRNEVRFDMKSDVYSYGVLLIEMGYGEASKIQEGMEYLRQSWSDLASLASQCMRHPNDRPTMREIIRNTLPNMEQ